VTVAPPDDPLLAPLRGARGLTVHCVPSDVMTTFALAYAGDRRVLTLRYRARPLVIDDIPAAWLRPPVAYVGPVIGECDTAFVHALGARFVGAGIQGWLRRAEPDGRIAPVRLADAAEVQDPPHLDVAVVSEEDHPGAEGVVGRFVRIGGAVAVTRGARGATVSTATESIDVPASPAREVDATGAGDVFGVVLTLALGCGCSLAVAGEVAADAAARVVEGPGLGTLSTPLPQQLESRTRVGREPDRQR
jgi:hypothetical protein